uniref:Uncharacterized protein n=1 Tax=Rhizophora mucronata TaxID=61149 RepID=A0A2P2QAW6_RHIMU
MGVRVNCMDRSSYISATEHEWGDSLTSLPLVPWVHFHPFYNIVSVRATGEF